MTSEEAELEVTPKKVTVYQKDVPKYANKELDDFVSCESLNLFKRINLEPCFLKKDVESWENDENYLKAKDVFGKLAVVNDSAERGIKLITEYSRILTKDEDHRQLILQIVKDFRENYPDVKKKTLKK